MGKALARMPGLFEEAASYQDPLRPAPPLSERIVDNMMMGLMALTAMSAAPIVLAGAGVAYAGEKLLNTVDVLHRVADKTHLFGQALKEQQQLIEEFGPLLQLAVKIPPLAEQAEEKAEAYQERSRLLDELKSNYIADPERLKKVSSMIVRFQVLLPQLLQEKNSTGLQALLLKQRLEIAHRISEKEQRINDLQDRLQGVMSRVQEKHQRLQQLRQQVSEMTQKKELQVEAVAKSAEDVRVIVVVNNKEIPHVRTVVA